MKNQQSLFLSFSALLLIALNPTYCKGQSDKSSESAEINVHQVLPEKLILFLAAQNRQNTVIVLNSPSHVIDLAGQGTMELLTGEIARRNDFESTTYDDVRFYTHGCSHRLALASVNTAAGGEKVTFNFPQTTTVHLYRLIADILKLQFRPSGDVDDSLMGVYLREKRMDELIAAIDTATGLETHIVNNSLVVKRRAKLEPCDAGHPELPSTILDSSNQSALVKSDERQRKREWLEQFDLNELVLRGFIRLKSKPYWALIESPAGLSSVRIGNYIGKNEGRIVEINTENETVRLIEIVESGGGGYIEHKAVLRVGIPYLDRVSVRKHHLAPIIDSSIQRAFVAAALAGDVNSLDSLFARGASLDASASVTTRNALANAVSAGRQNTVAWLLKKGTHTDILSSELEQAPLHIAVNLGYEDLVHQLVDAGADVNIEDYQERTPLDYAVDSSRLSIAVYLLTRHADPTITNDLGLAPFSLAAFRGNVALVTYLLAHGLNIDIQDDAGETMLGGASYGGNQELVELLVHKGANLNLENFRGDTAVDQALTAGHKDIATFLIARGGHATKK